MKIAPDEYLRVELRAHQLLADVPLHDVWAVDLAGGGEGRSVLDVQALAPLGSVADSNPVVRFLFGLRAWLGGLFGWDRAPRTAVERFVDRLTPEELESSLVVPGTPQGPFRALYASTRELISEIDNATVHAFSVFALVPRPPDHRLYWAIYVRPIGRITALYMALIDPFRRLLIYPAALRHIRRAWEREYAGKA